MAFDLTGLPPTPAEIASRLELERRVVDAVAELDEPYRSTLILHFYDGLKPVEIARHLGIPDATVRVRLKRALEKVPGYNERDFDTGLGFDLPLEHVGPPRGDRQRGDAEPGAHDDPVEGIALTERDRSREIGLAEEQIALDVLGLAVNRLRSSGLNSSRARAMPCRRAPA